jgi:hypothetical protein
VDHEHIQRMDIDTECSGFIEEVPDGTGSRFVCKECGGIVSKESVEEIIRILDFRDENCPYCREVNSVNGFADPLIYVCQGCGRTVTG